jgi:phosphatidylinositol alpha-mannosyltransferase
MPARPNKLKVGLVFDDSLDRPDGVQQYVMRVAEWLREHGHDVHLLVGETHERELPNLHSVSRNITVKFNGNTMSIPRPVSKQMLRRLLDELQLDVIHVQTPYSPFMAGRLISLAGPKVAVVGTFHILPYSWAVKLANRVLAVLNRRTGRRFDDVMAVSPPASEFARRYYGYNGPVVPNPFRLDDYTVAPRPKNPAPRIVFLGRLVTRKGVKQLLLAIKYMLEHGLYEGPLSVTIAGRGHLLEELKLLAGTIQGDVTIDFPGFIAEEDKPELIESADVFALPSISGESFGISLIEGLAAARGVVLAGDNAGYASILYELPELLVNPRDTEVFAALLARWLKDADGRAAMAKRQKQYVHQFDIAVVGPQIEQVYREALQSKRLP